MAFTVEIVSSFSFRQKFQKDSPIFLLPSIPSYPRLTLPIHPFSTFIAPTVSKLSQLIEPRLRIMEEFLRQFFLSKILLPFWSNSCFFAIAIAIQWLLDLGPEKLSTTAKLGVCVQKVLICHWDCQIITNYQSIGILSNNHKLSKHRNIVFHKTKSLESVCWYLSLTLTAVAHKLTKLQTSITICPFLTVSSFPVEYICLKRTESFW